MSQKVMRAKRIGRNEDNRQEREGFEEPGEKEMNAPPTHTKKASYHHNRINITTEGHGGGKGET